MLFTITLHSHNLHLFFLFNLLSCATKIKCWLWVQFIRAKTCNLGKIGTFHKKKQVGGIDKENLKDLDEQVELDNLQGKIVHVIFIENYI